MRWVVCWFVKCGWFHDPRAVKVPSHLLGPRSGAARQEPHAMAEIGIMSISTFLPLFISLSVVVFVCVFCLPLSLFLLLLCI